jgi:hypothetical protein
VAVIAVVTVLSIAVAAWLGAREPSGHRATAVVRLAASESRVASGIDPALSEIIVLTSRTVIGNAIESEGIRLVSSSSDAPGAPREQAIDYVLEHLEATPVPSDAQIRGLHVARLHHGAADRQRDRARLSGGERRRRPA